MRTVRVCHHHHTVLIIGTKCRSQTNLNKFSFIISRFNSYLVVILVYKVIYHLSSCKKQTIHLHGNNEGMNDGLAVAGFQRWKRQLHFFQCLIRCLKKCWNLTGLYWFVHQQTRIANNLWKFFILSDNISYLTSFIVLILY